MQQSAGRRQTRDPRSCTPRSRCNNTRECDRCAAIRQAQIADEAERRLCQYLQHQLIVLRTEQGDGEALRAHLRALIKSAELRAGIWTIERGERCGTLHANIITHAAELVGAPGAIIHAEPLRAGLRAAAAYISKRRQRPAAEDYAGRAYGAWGQVGQIVAGADMPLLVQAATCDAAIRAATQKAVTPPQTAEPTGPAPQTMDDYRRIAARHLPHLAAIANQFLARAPKTGAP